MFEVKFILSQMSNSSVWLHSTNHCLMTFSCVKNFVVSLSNTQFHWSTQCCLFPFCSCVSFNVICSNENVKEQYCQCSTVRISAYKVIVPLLLCADLMMFVFIDRFSIIVPEEAGLRLWDEAIIRQNASRQRQSASHHIGWWCMAGCSSNRWLTAIPCCAKITTVHRPWAGTCWHAGWQNVLNTVLACAVFIHVVVNR